jgi:hypothetical protein
MDIKLTIQKLLFAIALVSVIACVKKPVDPVTDNPPSTGNQSGVDVYIAGHSSVGACYWKNDTLVKLLTPGIIGTKPSDNVGGVAYNIVVKGKDVYLGGTISNSAQGRADAAYWKNGVATTLTGVVKSENTEHRPTVYVNGNDVYVVGTRNILPLTSGAPVPAYWKNNIVQTLQLLPGDVSLDANGLAVIGNDVYVTGAVRRNGVNKTLFAAYWKNGIQYKFQEIGVPRYTTAITTQGNDWYVSGYCTSDFGDAVYWQKGGYWKNGVFNALSTDFHRLNTIAVNGSDVYLAGSIAALPDKYGLIIGANAAYWKNGSLVARTGDKIPDMLTTSNEGDSFTASSIALNGDDAYVIGNFYNITNYANNGNQSYLKNNALVKFSTDVNAVGYGIYVVNK